MNPMLRGSSMFGAWSVAYCPPSFQESTAKPSEASSLVDHLSLLSPFEHKLPQKLTSIMCTIGPSSNFVDIIEAMIENGMDVARINFSYGDHVQHREMIENVREAAMNVRMRSPAPVAVAIAMDTKGPEIRTGEIERGGTVELEHGASVKITTDENMALNCNPSTIYVDYEDMANVVEAGLKIYIDNSSIVLVVDRVKDNDIYCTIINGGILGPGKNVTAPGLFRKKLDISANDVVDVEFAIQENVDCILVSYTMGPSTILKIKHIIQEANIGHPLVFAKIENRIAINGLQEILEVADGIMVSRGDIAMEVPLEQVCSFQKSIIAQCNKSGKPVICSNRMLLSMLTNKKVTRAESFDVANSILDGADCVMLSEETAVGMYPAKAVRAMAYICKEAEMAMWTANLFLELSDAEVAQPREVSDTVAYAAVASSFNCLAKAIIVLSGTGKSAKLVSKFRPPCPVIVVTRHESHARQFCFYRSIIPLLYEKPVDPEWTDDVDHRWQYGMDYAKNAGIVSAGEHVVIIAGWRLGTGLSNTMRIETVS